MGILQVTWAMSPATLPFKENSQNGHAWHRGIAVQHEKAGISYEVLIKAAQVTEDDLQQGRKLKLTSKAGIMGGSLRRAIPPFLAERQMRQDGGKAGNASVEVQLLSLAEEYEILTTGQQGANMSPAQAGQEVVKRSQGRYDSMIVDGFAKAFGAQTGSAAGA